MEFNDEQMAAIQAMIDDATSALKNKNNELINEKRTATTKAREEQEAREAAEQETLAKSGDIEALKKSLTDKHAKDVEALNAKLREHVVDGAISNALARGNVMPGFADAVTALYRAKAVYADGAAMIDGQSIGDYVAAHLASEAGAAFVRAPQNSGGGAMGSTAKTQTMTKENWNHTEFAKLKISNPAEAEAVAKAAGMERYL